MDILQEMRGQGLDVNSFVSLPPLVYYPVTFPDLNTFVKLPPLRVPLSMVLHFMFKTKVGCVWRWSDARLLFPPTHSVCLSIHPSVHLSSCPWVRFCLDDISWTAEPFLSKLGIVAYYDEAESHAKILVHYLQCLGHKEGLYNQNMTISNISSKVLDHLQPNLFDSTS